ncbi:hypothetical protein [Anabaena sp. UHCC 0204]|uniref:hypothetical protein n=1 Tax=Anabaena sp. UHCC 0204 TaxID=2590009 RepID=UPI001447B724|nr:hypothetical protein [Anabaena sp. UHCC 0204]MTJ10553.1 hypothetical protein [Anabaena sp. UHCC 0204]
MSKQSIYEQQAKLNEEIAKKAQTDSPEWAIIMYFYAALHWVNDYANKRGEIYKLQPTDSNKSPHRLRLIYVKKISPSKGKEDELYKNYRFLFEESKVARYLEDGEFNCINMTAKEYYKQCNIKEYIDSLEIIKKMLRN